MTQATVVSYTRPSPNEDGAMPKHSPLSRADDAGPWFVLFMPISFALTVAIVSWLSMGTF